MADLPAVNTSPLIYLSRAGMINLLQVASDHSRKALPAARPVIERLIDSGMYLSARVLNAALAEVGE